MKLLDLHNKLQKSGIDGNPIITDDELKELKSKLEEFREYADAVPLVSNALSHERWAVTSVLWNREN